MRDEALFLCREYKEEQKMKVSFSPPDITQEEIDEAAEALKSGWVPHWPQNQGV